MNGEEVCVAVIGILVSALLASPFMVIWYERRAARERKRNRRRPGRGGGGAG